MSLGYYIRRDSDGTLAGEGAESGVNVSLAAVQARLPAGLTALDAAVSSRPPAAVAPADPLRVAYGAALTVDAKLDVIAQRLGLK